MQQYWIVLNIAAAIMAASGNVQDIQVSVISVQPKFDAVQDVAVILKYKNLGSDTIFIHKDYVPNKELHDPLFEVTRDGKRVEYVGPVFKRRAATVEDVMPLAPGTEVRALVQLSSVYDMTQSGNYIIKYKMNAHQVLFTMDRMLNVRAASFNDGQNFILQSGSIPLFIEGRRNLLIERFAETNAQRTSERVDIGCSANQSNAIATAVREARNYATSTLQYLTNTPPSGTTRYTTWLGRFSSANWATFKAHFQKIENAVNTQPLSFDCGCAQGSSSTFAYVYPNQHYRIYLCGAFWPAPAAGTDSKGGTIVHEVSHFTIVTDTDDHEYGHSACQNLAKTNPAMALMNADTHEYFAENNPALN